MMMIGLVGREFDCCGSSDRNHKLLQYQTNNYIFHINLFCNLSYSTILYLFLQVKTFLDACNVRVDLYEHLSLSIE